MSSDALSRALQSRRGKSVDHSVMSLRDNPPGHMVALNPSQDIPQGDSDGHTEIDAKVGLHEAPHDLEVDHQEGHTPVVGEQQAKSPMGGEVVEPEADAGMLVDTDFRDAVGGQGSQMEYDSMKGNRPRSLGERAKMMALKEKFDGGDKTK